MGIKESLFGVWNKFVEGTTNGLYQLSQVPQQRFIRFIINNNIKQYLLNPIQKDEFESKFNMGGGVISMKDVVLDTKVLNERFVDGLPFKFEQVTIESIDFEIPLFSINTMPIKVKVRGIEVILTANNDQALGSIVEGDNSYSSISNSTSTDELSSSIRHLMNSDDHSSMDSSILAENLRPEDNDEVFDCMQAKIFEILSNGIVEIENLSIFIQTPSSASTLELNILAAIFSYDKQSRQDGEECEEQEEQPFGNAANRDNLKPKLEFNQLSMMVHKKDESINAEPSDKYFFGSRIIKEGGDLNSLIISQSTDNELIVDIKFNSVINGSFGQEQLGDLLDLVNKLSDALTVVDEVTTSPSTASRSSSSSSLSQYQKKQPKDVSVRIAIPRLDYLISLPLLRDTVSTKKDFKIHFIGESTQIQYSKRYLPDEGSITVTELSFLSIELNLLPNGDPQSKYRFLYLHGGDGDNLTESSNHVDRIYPKITIVQKPHSYIIQDIDESKYVNNPFLTYKSPATLTKHSIEHANSLSTMIIDCQLPDCLLSLYKSDYECLMNAFSFTSDEPQTSTMLFTLSTRVTLELRFDPYLIANSRDPDRVKVFKLLTGDLDLLVAMGYPSDTKQKDLYDSMFAYLSLGSLDTIASCISKEQLFFSSRSDLDGIELMIASHGVTITNQFELSISEICFVPSMRLITDFLDWIKLEPAHNSITDMEASVICNNKNINYNSNNNQNQNNAISPYHIELVNCTAKFFTRETKSQIMLLYEKLSILVSPEGKEDDLCLVFQPVQILYRDASDDFYSFEHIQNFKTIGYSTKELMIYLKNVTASEKGIKVEILSNTYQLEFDKNSYHAVTKTVPIFLQKIFERIVISNQDVSNDNIAKFLKSQVNSPNMIEDYGESKVSSPLSFANGGNVKQVDDIDELDDFEMIQSELDLKRTMEIVMLDINIKCKLFDNQRKDHIVVEAVISELLMQSYETPNETAYSNSIRLNMSELFIRDFVHQSPYQNLFGPLSFYNKKKNSQYLISLVLYSRKDSFERDHYNLKVFIDPLFIQAFQTSVDFILDFFLTDNSNSNGNNEQPSNNNNKDEDTVIFDGVEIFPLSVRIDYKPKSLNHNDGEESYSSFTSGEYVWMVSMIPLNEAMFTFPKVELYNIPQSKLVERIFGIYYPNLNTNVFQYLTGVAPVKILFNVGSGITALVRQPIRRARGPEGVIVGVGKGVGMGITTLTVELLSASVSIVKTGSSFLKALTHQDTSLARQPQPDSISKGAQKAVSQVIGGFKNAAMGILYKPIVEYKSDGAKGFLSALLWGVPRVVVDPVVGVAEGFTTFSTSIRNSLDSSRIINERKKYKIKQANK